MKSILICIGNLTVSKYMNVLFSHGQSKLHISFLQLPSSITMRSSLVLLALPALAMAFPGMMPKEDIVRAMEEQRRAEAKVEKRQGLSAVTDLLNTVLSDVSGLVGSVAESVNPDNLRPESGYTFEAPGPNDSRGPCPGLNLLANYGYLPRNGYVNFGQVVEAAS
jgi:hypothetical protein